MSDRRPIDYKTPTSMIPCVEVVERPDYQHQWCSQSQSVIPAEPVLLKRLYGVTLLHAMRRALRWSRAQGLST